MTGYTTSNQSMSISESTSRLSAVTVNSRHSSAGSGGREWDLRIASAQPLERKVPDSKFAAALKIDAGTASLWPSQQLFSHIGHLKIWTFFTQQTLQPKQARPKPVCDFDIDDFDLVTNKQCIEIPTEVDYLQQQPGQLPHLSDSPQ